MAVCIVAFLLLTEVFSGALRYLFGESGFASILYAPKVLGLVFIFVELLFQKSKKYQILVLLFISLFSCLALYQGASVENVLFSLYTFSPLALGVVTRRYLESGRAFVWILFACVIASCFGVILNNFSDLPWQGYLYQIGDVEIQGSKEWASFSLARLAGFSRVSTSAAIFITLPALYVIPLIRNRIAAFLFALIPVWPLYLTNHKASISAYALTLLIGLFFRVRTVMEAAVAILIVVCIWFPFSTLFIDYNLGLTSDLDLLLLASFDDRLNNSWPNFIGIVNNTASAVFGAGFGAVGSSAQYFSISSMRGANSWNLAVADNSALYMWGMFGIFGIALVLSLFVVLRKIYVGQFDYGKSCFFVAFAVLVMAITTDVAESLACLFFLGISISHSTLGNIKQRPSEIQLPLRAP